MAEEGIQGGLVLPSSTNLIQVWGMGLWRGPYGYPRPALSRPPRLIICSNKSRRRGSRTHRNWLPPIRSGATCRRYGFNITKSRSQTAKKEHSIEFQNFLEHVPSHLQSGFSLVPHYFIIMEDQDELQYIDKIVEILRVAKAAIPQRLYHHLLMTLLVQTIFILYWLGGNPYQSQGLVFCCKPLRVALKSYVDQMIRTRSQVKLISTPPSFDHPRPTYQEIAQLEEGTRL